MINKDGYLKLKKQRILLSNRLTGLKHAVKSYNRIASNFDKYPDNQRLIHKMNHSRTQCIINILKLEYNLINELIQSTKELLKIKGK